MWLLPYKCLGHGSGLVALVLGFSDITFGRLLMYYSTKDVALLTWDLANVAQLQENKDFHGLG